jgi:hypothetical protein
VFGKLEKERNKKKTTYLLTFSARRPSEGLLSRPAPQRPSTASQWPSSPTPSSISGPVRPNPLWAGPASRSSGGPPPFLSLSLTPWALASGTPSLTFGWFSARARTQHWVGVRLRPVLSYCRARHVKPSRP